jgi:HemY protein
MIETTWEAEPHPALIEPYWNAQKSTDALERVRATQRLAKRFPGNPESFIALGRASLEARLWGEARKHLESAIDAAGGPPPARVCRMTAELEESENDDPALAREWLMRASTAGADPAWVCDHCGNSVGQWSVVCGKCESFDSFRWRTPPSIVSLPEGETANSKLITEGPAALPTGGIEAG